MIAVVVFGRLVSARLWLCREITFVDFEDEEWVGVFLSVRNVIMYVLVVNRLFSVA